ncbi:MAG: T9SS type A sorting domain-containing protein [Saprospiraceae bacterium]
MKKSILLLIGFLAFICLKAQPVLYNGPTSLLANISGQYSSIQLPVGVTVNWSISGIGASIQGSSTNALVFYDVATSPIILTATLSNSTSYTDTIPVYQQGSTLYEGIRTMSNGTRMYPIYQLLRGERFKIKPINYTGAAPKLTLLDFQGRYLIDGDSIDFRAPIRGSYYIIVEANSGGQLQVEGIRQYIPATGGINQTTTFIPDNCSVGNLDFAIDSTQNLTGAESMVTLGNKVVTCWYDFGLKKTVVKAYQNDLLQWTWLSNENEYLRTITADPNFGISGIGSCGGALRSDDSVLVVKLNSNGILQTRTAFGTSNGIDYGYGISFLNDGSLMGTGFTEGNFPPTQSTGQLDAFAVHISTTGTILNTLQYGSSVDDRVFASRTLTNGNVLLFGDTEGQIGDTGSPFGSGDIFVTEISPSCVRLNNTQYGSNENDLAFDLVVEPLGGDIFITGMTIGEMVSGFGNPNKPQVYTARINKTTKSIVWLKQLGPTEGQSGESIALAPNGIGTIFYTNGSFVGASNNSLGSQASDDMVMALFDFNGNLDTLFQFDQTQYRIFARAITFEGSNIFVLRDHAYEPSFPTVTTSLDRFANPLALTTGLTNVDVQNQLTVFPNPTTTELNISFPSTNNFKIEIINTIGVTVLESQNQNKIDVSQLSKGVYFIKAVDNKTIYTQKIIVQ